MLLNNRRVCCSVFQTQVTSCDTFPQGYSVASENNTVHARTSAHDKYLSYTEDVSPCKFTDCGICVVAEMKLLMSPNPAVQTTRPASLEFSVEIGISPSLWCCSDLANKIRQEISKLDHTSYVGNVCSRSFHWNGWCFPCRFFHCSCFSRKMHIIEAMFLFCSL